MQEVNIKNIQKSISRIAIMMFAGLNLLIQPIGIIFFINNHIKWYVILVICLGFCGYLFNLSLFICTNFIEIIFVGGLNANVIKNRRYRMLVWIYCMIIIPIFLLLTIADELNLSNIMVLITQMNMPILLPIALQTNSAILYDDWIIHGTTIAKITDIVEYINNTVCVFKKKQRVTIILNNKQQIILTGKEHQFDQLIDYIELHKYIEKHYAKEKAECKNN